MYSYSSPYAIPVSELETMWQILFAAAMAIADMACELDGLDEIGPHALPPSASDTLEKLQAARDGLELIVPRLAACVAAYRPT